MTQRSRPLRMAALAALLFHGAATLARAQTDPPDPDPDLTRLTIEQLMDIEVTSAARKRETLGRTAAALFVISREEILRSGATTLAEALRLAPGVDVARILSNQWSVSARGFGGRFANKLLILVDGRTVYTPLFSGVYWDALDTVLPDIDRIEIIRGPGAALWGANAMNGVINIITRPAAETAGFLGELSAGREERAIATVRYGDRLADDAHFRAFAKYADRDDSPSQGRSAEDSWHIERAGFRADWKHHQDDFTVQADVYQGRVRSILTTPLLVPPFAERRADPMPVRGGDVLGRWTRSLGPGSDFTLQAYYDGYRRDSIILDETRHTFDFDFQHYARWGQRQEIVWGLGYRLSTDDQVGTFVVSFDPARREDNLLSAFVHDEIAVVPGRLQMNVGARVERHDFTGLEVQPSLRVLWTPHRRHTLWGALSRAVRTPSRAEQDVRLAAAVPAPGVLVVALGNQVLDSETLVAVELGYRVQPIGRVSVDLTAFWNRYDDLRSADPEAPFLEDHPAPPHVVQPVRAGNRGSGRTWGAEVQAEWAVVSRLKVKANYSFLRMSLEGPASSDSTLTTGDGQTPEHQLHALALLDLGRRWEYTAAFHRIAARPALGVPAYSRVDGRIAFVPWPQLQLAITGQNLLEKTHLEFGPSLLVEPSEIERSVFGTLTVRF